MSRAPEFSPAMLRLHLTARAMLARIDDRHSAKEFARVLAKRAGVRLRSVQLAIDGRLKKADPRVRLWAALGHFPADFGIVLDDRGGQSHG